MKEQIAVLVQCPYCNKSVITELPRTTMGLVRCYEDKEGGCHRYFVSYIKYIPTESLKIELQEEVTHE